MTRKAKYQRFAILAAMVFALIGAAPLARPAFADGGVSNSFEHRWWNSIPGETLLCQPYNATFTYTYAYQIAGHYASTGSGQIVGTYTFTDQFTLTPDWWEPGTPQPPTYTGEVHSNDHAFAFMPTGQVQVVEIFTIDLRARGDDGSTFTGKLVQTVTYFPGGGFQWDTQIVCS